MRSGLLAEASQWAEMDPDPATAAALIDLMSRAMHGDSAAEAEIASAFAGPLEFGTAGLRGALGPGPARMNRIVVSRAAAGLAAYLNAEAIVPGGRIVVGHDARYNSEVFARDTVEILAGAGFDAILVDQPTPTPVVAFAIRQLAAVAAIVVTASHNPPRDNGYKVYLGDGCQIIPPADQQIAAHIAAVGDIADLARSDSWRYADPELLEAYLDRVASLTPAPTPAPLRWVYTPLHGVGLATVADVVARAGYPTPSVVTAQAEPDPSFPTVAFPNPEEPGALDLAFTLAEETSADLVIANDPDADRCAVAVREDGHWHALTGDELGTLLADDFLSNGVVGNYAASVVSSTLLGRMATAHGQRFVTTLTGFKWIARVPDLAFGYEEALGYCCDQPAVADKDGISTLLRVLSIANRLAANGSSINERLAHIARSFGLHYTDQLAFRVDDLSLITAAMHRVRQDPPSTLLGEPLTRLDLAVDETGLPPTNALAWAGESLRVVVRPSGTEPKLKCYLEVRLCPAESTDVPAARTIAASRMQELRAEVAAVLGISGNSQ